MRNTPPLRALWRELISYNEARPDLPDQVALNELLATAAAATERANSSRAGPRLRVARLDPARFVNGYRFYERNRSRHEAAPRTLPKLWPIPSPRPHLCQPQPQPSKS